MPRVQTPSHLRREYECIYLIDQALEDPQVDEVVQRYRQTVTNQGGKVVQIDNWGKRKLAYEIHKQQKATYVYMQFLAVSGVVAELERTMRLADEVIRWQTVLINDQVDPSARPEATGVNRRVAEEEEDTGRDDRRDERRASSNDDRDDDRNPRAGSRDDESDDTDDE